MTIQSGRHLYRTLAEAAAAEPETALAAPENSPVDRGRILYRRSRSGDESVLREYVEYTRAQPDGPDA